MTTGDRQQQTTRRPHYRTQQLLTAEQLNGAQAYHAEQMRRLVHGLAGTGVVYGFDLKVTAEAKETCARCIEIGCGLAFDHLGRQLYWAGGALSAKEFIAPPEEKGRYMLQVHYAERRIKAPQLEECGEEAVQWIEEGVLFSLKRLEKGQCPTTEDACEKLENPCDPVRDYVCTRLTDGELCPKEPTDLCATGDDEWWYDLAGGIPLACIEVCDLGEKCDPRFGFAPWRTDVRKDLCDVRPFVYRNPLLFDLQRACHVALVHVARVSFESWTGIDRSDPVPWEKFETLVKHDGVEIWFSAPVRSETLNDASVFLTAIVEEPESYFQDVLRIPVRMKLLKEAGGFARGVHLLFGEESKGEYESPWIQRQIDDRKSRFAENEAGSLIELTIRTSLIRDTCDPPRLLDGRPIDITKDDPAQAMPGVDFVAKFFVEQKGAIEHHESYEQSAPDSPVQGAE